MDERFGGIEGRKGFHRYRYDLPAAGRGKMGSKPMTSWKMIEILKMILFLGSRLEKKFEANRRIGKWRKTMGDSFQRKVGFRNIKRPNWKLPSGFPSFLLSYRVLLNL